MTTRPIQSTDGPSLQEKLQRIEARYLALAEATSQALCDIGLPGGMDGYALARTLRGREDTSGIHLIAISGYGQEEDQRQARESGFDRHLTKLVDPGMLLRLLEEQPAASLSSG
jgi:CheY-like chemotaxis protein